jgi:hypothetical protein
MLPKTGVLVTSLGTVSRRPRVLEWEGLPKVSGRTRNRRGVALSSWSAVAWTALRAVVAISTYRKCFMIMVRFC